MEIWTSSLPHSATPHPATPPSAPPPLRPSSFLPYIHRVYVHELETGEMEGERHLDMGVDTPFTKDGNTGSLGVRHTLPARYAGGVSVKVVTKTGLRIVRNFADDPLVIMVPSPERPILALSAAMAPYIFFIFFLLRVPLHEQCSQNSCSPGDAELDPRVLGDPSEVGAKPVTVAHALE
jgi:hypothetical protein